MLGIILCVVLGVSLTSLNNFVFCLYIVIVKHAHNNSGNRKAKVMERVEGSHGSD
jgi:hypothetical protein